jgi:hypothetical protein
VPEIVAVARPVGEGTNVGIEAALAVAATTLAAVSSPKLRIIPNPESPTTPKPIEIAVVVSSVGGRTRRNVSSRSMRRAEASASCS